MKTVEQHRAVIERRLATFGRRWRQVRMRTGIARTLMVAVLVVLTACMVDYFLALSTPGRFWLSAVAYAAIFIDALVTWILPLVLPMRRERLAWMLERAFPDFDERLISSVELSRVDKQTERPSVELLAEVLTETELELAQVQPEQALPLTWRDYVLPVAAVLLFSAGFLLPSVPMPQLVKRVLLPSVRDAAMGAFVLTLEGPVAEAFAEGDPVVFRVRSSNSAASEVELHLDGARRRQLTMHATPEPGLFELTVPDLRSSFRYRAVAGRVTTARFDMRMLRLPRIDSYRRDYRFPAYAGLAPVSEESRSGNLRALEGSEVLLTLRATKPLRALWLEYMAERYDAAVAMDGMQAMCRIHVQEPGEYVVHLVDTDGLHESGRVTWRVEAIDDAPPSVALQHPVDGFALEPEQVLPIRWTAQDDFGVVAQTLSLSVNGHPPAERHVSADAAAYALNLSSLDVQAGDTLRVGVTAVDAIGQRSVTPARVGKVVRGPDLVRSATYRREGARLLGRLDAAELELQAMERLAAALRDARVYRTEGALEDRIHNRAMLASRRERFAQQVEDAQLVAMRMGRHGFFRRADEYAQLLGDYLRDERVRIIPGLTDEPGNEAVWARAATLVALGQQMGTGLVVKAEEQVAHLEVRDLQQAGCHHCLQSDPASATWDARIRQGLIASTTNATEIAAYERLKLGSRDAAVPPFATLPRGLRLHVARHVALRARAEDFRALDALASRIRAQRKGTGNDPALAAADVAEASATAPALAEHAEKALRLALQALAADEEVADAPVHATPYYRRAMQQYLKRVAEERARWQPAAAGESE